MCILDLVFADPHTIWAEHVSGSFSQFDLRQATRPIDAIPRVSATWDVSGSVVFAADKPKRFEPPYDDMLVFVSVNTTFWLTFTPIATLRDVK